MKSNDSWESIITCRSISIRVFDHIGVTMVLNPLWIACHEIVTIRFANSCTSIITIQCRVVTVFKSRRQLLTRIIRHHPIINIRHHPKMHAVADVIVWQRQSKCMDRYHNTIRLRSTVQNTSDHNRIEQKFSKSAKTRKIVC